jgi:redox-sensitive bicupin YhaK (pirin superfamily)
MTESERRHRNLARFAHPAAAPDTLRARPTTPKAGQQLVASQPATEGQGSCLWLVGGVPFGETILMWWNFLARTTEEIVAAWEDWQAERRFGDVRDYAPW